jgi:hypothetical protein
LTDALESRYLKQYRVLYPKVITKSANDKPEANFIGLRLVDDLNQELLRYVHWILMVQNGFS